jgi:tetratricopeptide (TPR) repeat protein
MVLGTIWALAGMTSAWRARDALSVALARERAAGERQRAAAEFSEFAMFYGGPGLDGQPPPLRLVLERLTPMIAVRWAGRPQLEAAVRVSLGRAFLALGEPARAVQQLRLAWAAIDARALEDPEWSTLVLHDLSRAERQAQEPDASRAHLTRMLELGARAVAATSPEVGRRLEAIAHRPAARRTRSRRRVALRPPAHLLSGMQRESPDFLIGGRLLAAVGLALQSDHRPGSDDLMQRLEQIARQVLGNDVDFQVLLARFAQTRLQVGQLKEAIAMADEVLADLQRKELTEHWLSAQAERIRGQALVRSGEGTAGEAALLALRERLAPFAATGNEQVRAALAALGELCASLAKERARHLPG